MDIPQIPKLITPLEAERITCVTRRTLARWADDGRIHKYKATTGKGGGKVRGSIRYDEHELRTLMGLFERVPAPPGS